MGDEALVRKLLDFIERRLPDDSWTSPLYICKASMTTHGNVT